MGGGVIDLALWLEPLDGENPSGEDLRNDARFHELQVKVVAHDDRDKPAEKVSVPMDWAGVLETAEELRSQGRDLRLLVTVTRALVNENGLAGLAEGLGLIVRTLDLFWDTLHPALRENAPPRDAALRRVNALAALQGADGLLYDVRHRIFFSPPLIGPVSGADLERGALDEFAMLQEKSGLSAAERAADIAKHEQLLDRVSKGCAAQADKAAPAMAELISDAKAALAAVEALDTALNARLGEGASVLPDLKRLLERMLSTLERGTAAHAPANGAVAQAAAAAPAAGPASHSLGNGHAPVSATVNGGSGMSLPERISSRDDVVKCLDLVVAFYDRTEPSSPIPHLARRVRRMVHMDFVELMEDLAPSGLKEFRLLAGVPDNKKTAQKDER